MSPIEGAASFIRPPINWVSQKLDVSISHGFLNKQPLNADSWTDGFVPFQVTPAELAEAVKHGLTYGPVFRRGRRLKENFVKCGVISLDFDGEVTAEEIGLSPLVREASTIVYTTSNDSPEARRFRLVFALETPIERVSEWVAATRTLALQLNSDLAATDGARIFHGNNHGTARVFDRGLSNERIQELVELGKNAHQTEDYNGKWVATGRSAIKLDKDQLVRKSNQTELLPLSSLDRAVSIHCPKHPDRNASAFVIESQKGTKGVRCLACGVSYWPQDDLYDFETFDTAVRMTRDFAEQAQPFNRFLSPELDSPYKSLFPTQETIDGISDAKIHILDKPFLRDLKLPLGVSYIKSPKASGKTEALVSLVSDPTTSVLLIGHRRALIRQMCERLDLNCYLDEGADGAAINYKRYGVCLDSLSKVRDFKYDYVLIDESEQVLAHFLSKTMEDKRSSLIYRLQHHVAKAKRVVVLDADLGWASFRFFNGCGRSPDVENASTIFLNDHISEKKAVRVFDSKNHLIGEIHQAVARGERCYITANSKTLIESLYESLTEHVPPGEIIQITGANSQDPMIQSFLSNIKDQAEGYRAILTSPSVSTGVDISFDDGRQVIDHVFGIFEPKITTHFECDQQLLRVRSPKTVSVFLSPSTYGFETNLDVVREDLLIGRLMETLIDGYKVDGSPNFRAHPLLELACGVVSVERASKNNLKRNFIAYKERQKYPIEFVPADPLMADKGKDRLRVGTEKVDEKYVRSLLEARRLSQEEMTLVEEQLDHNESVLGALKASYDRTRIELFYRVPITRALIERDDRWRFQAAVGTYEGFIRPNEVKLRSQILETKEFKDPLHKVLYSEHFRIAFLQKALAASGLWDGEAFVWDRVIDTRDLSEFVTVVQELKPQYEMQFGNEIYSDLVLKPVSQLNTFLRLIGLSLKPRKRRIALGQKRITQYEWDDEKVEEMEQISKRRSRYPNPWLALDSDPD